MEQKRNDHDSYRHTSKRDTPNDPHNYRPSSAPATSYDQDVRGQSGYYEQRSYYESPNPSPYQYSHNYPRERDYGHSEHPNYSVNYSNNAHYRSEERRVGKEC